MQLSLFCMCGGPGWHQCARRVLLKLVRRMEIARLAEIRFGEKVTH